FEQAPAVQHPRLSESVRGKPPGDDLGEVHALRTANPAGRRLSLTPAVEEHPRPRRRRSEHRRRPEGAGGGRILGDGHAREVSEAGWNRACGNTERRENGGSGEDDLSYGLRKPCPVAVAVAVAEPYQRALTPTRRAARAPLRRRLRRPPGP